MSSYIRIEHIVEKTDDYTIYIEKSNQYSKDNQYSISISLTDKAKSEQGLHPLDEGNTFTVDMSSQSIRPSGTMQQRMDYCNHMVRYMERNPSHRTDNIRILNVEHIDSAPVYTEADYHKFIGFCLPLVEKYVSAENLNRLDSEIVAKEVVRAQRKVANANRALEKMLARQAELAQR